MRGRSVAEMVPHFLILAGLLCAQVSGTSKESQFADYPSSAVSPTLATPGQRRFRTVIRDWVKKGPNFAGHYTIAEWGCGSACEQIAVVDTLSGEVYEGPFGILPNGLIYLGPNVEEDKTGLFYRRNSSLFVARGCPNDQACGAYYYVWTGTQFKLLRKVPMKPLLGSE
jgi:hypothetical protein